MTVAQGYGKTVTSGSVFAYDVADTRNSYIGEPTVNLITNNIAGDYGNAPGSSTTTLSPDGTSNATVPIPDATADRYQQSRSGGTYSTGTQLTYSWHYKQLGTHAGSTPNEPGGLYITGLVNCTLVGSVSKVSDLPSGWTRWQATFQITDGSLQTIIRLYFGFVIGIGGSSAAYYGHQLEQKSHATPFTTGTRSATQGLLPLIGNSAIDLSNVSFDSNAQLIWDGTDDTLAVSDTVTHKPNTSFTYEIVFKPLGGGTLYDKMLIGKPGWHTGIMYQYSTIWFRTRYGSPAFYDTSGYSVTQGNYYHAVATYTSNTSMKFYVNGTLIGENNSVTTPLFDIGDTLNIGGNSVNYSSYVEIPAVKTYNRALSAAEVKQNYLHYKTRFNLS
jgi:hypothetical protein